MAKTITKIQHEDTNDVDIRVNKRKSLIKEFSLVGRLNTMHAKINTNENIDIIDLMDNLKPTSRKLFKEIKDRLDFKTNAAELDKPKNKNAGKSRSGATNILKQHKAIKKTGQRIFIVNPYLIVPPVHYQEDILAKWNSLP
jgi:hypothetical protein